MVEYKISVYPFTLVNPFQKVQDVQWTSSVPLRAPKLNMLARHLDFTLQFLSDAIISSFNNIPSLRFPPIDHLFGIGNLLWTHFF